MVYTIWGTHKADLESGMLKQRPSLDITRSNWYQVWAQVDQDIFHCIQSAQDNITELCDLQHFESDAEHVEFNYSLQQTLCIFFL